MTLAACSLTTGHVCQSVVLCAAANFNLLLGKCERGVKEADISRAREAFAIDIRCEDDRKLFGYQETAQRKIPF